MIRYAAMIGLALATLAVSACGRTEADEQSAKDAATSYLDALRDKRYADAYNLLHPNAPWRSSPGKDVNGWVELWKKAEPQGAADFDYTIEDVRKPARGGATVPHTVIARMNYKEGTDYGRAQRSTEHKLSDGSELFVLRSISVGKSDEGWKVLSNTPKLKDDVLGEAAKQAQKKSE